MFKPNPKKQVELKFTELFGRNLKPRVEGRRLSPEEATRMGLKCLSRDGLYLSELYLNDEVVAFAAEREWRRSYKMLKLEVEKLFTESTSLI